MYYIRARLKERHYVPITCRGPCICARRCHFRPILAKYPLILRHKRIFCLMNANDVITYLCLKFETKSNPNVLVIQYNLKVLNISCILSSAIFPDVNNFLDFHSAIWSNLWSEFIQWNGLTSGGSRDIRVSQRIYEYKDEIPWGSFTDLWTFLAERLLFG